MGFVSLAVEAQGPGFWGWIERSSWVVGILAALVPAAIALLTARGARSEKSRSAGDRIIAGNTFEGDSTINVGDVVTIQRLLYQPLILPAKPGLSARPTNASGGAGDTRDDDVWPRVIGMVAVGVAAFYLYVNYREWALGFTGGAIAVTLAMTTATTLVVFKLGDRGVNAGLVLNMAAVGAAAALLVRIAVRATPYGSYPQLRQMIRADDWMSRIFVDHGGVLEFVLFELSALIYIVIVMFAITMRQLGTVAAIAAARRDFDSDSGPSLVVRHWAPRTRRQLWGTPVLLTAVVALAWFLSSQTAFDLFQAWSTNPIPVPGTTADPAGAALG